MKKTLCLMATLLVLAGTGSAPCSAAQEQVVTRAGSLPSATGSHKTFTGTVRHDPVFAANDAAPYSVSYVTFVPGARTFWHTHPAGQRLIVVFGAGMTATWDGRVVVIRPGDTVWCPPDIKHWHGAAPDTAMTHMALTGMKEGKNVTWMEEVSEEQYRAAVQSHERK